MNGKKMFFAMAVVAALVVPAMGQQCGSDQVDLGNFNLGQQLISQAGGSGMNNDLNVQLASMTEQVRQLQNALAGHAPRQAASASSSAGGGLTSPGFLTFQDTGVAHSEMIPVPVMQNNGEVNDLRNQVASLMAEINAMKTQRPVFQTAAFQSGGAAASSSASTAAPSVNQLALSLPTPAASRQSSSSCSGGSCGGRRFQLFGRGGGRQVSRSRSFSSSTSR